MPKQIQERYLLFAHSLSQHSIISCVNLRLLLFTFPSKGKEHNRTPFYCYLILLYLTQELFIINYIQRKSSYYFLDSLTQYSIIVRPRCHITTTNNVSYLTGTRNRTIDKKTFIQRLPSSTPS